MGNLSILLMITIIKVHMMTYIKAHMRASIRMSIRYIWIHIKNTEGKHGFTYDGHPLGYS